MNWVPTALSYLGASSLPAVVIYLWATRRKTGADAAAVLTGSALAFVQQLRDELDETNAELRAMRRHMGVMESAMRRKGVPIPEFKWPPPARVGG